MTSANQSLYNLSRDYEKLYGLICEGQIVAAWADSYSMRDKDDNPQRDICAVKRYAPYEIIIGCRGTGYGSIFPFMQEEGEEQALFIGVCSMCNLAWIDPDPLTPTAKAT